MTLAARRFASRTSDTWPSWSAPMVGTSAVVAFFARRLSRARRNAGIVRTIMGLRDIWARSLGSGRLPALGWRWECRPYQGRCLAAKRVARPPRLIGQNQCPPIVRPITDSTAPAVRFMIKADDQRFENAIAHFT